MKIENVIFSNLLYNEEYTRKVIPFLKTEYFSDNNDRIIFDLINQHIQTYNTLPTKQTLFIDLDSNDKVSQDTYNTCKEVINTLEGANNDIGWLVSNTEKFCQEKSVYNAIMESINILDDKTGKKSKGSIPQLLADAISVSFDNHIGHDFLEDSDARYDFYHVKEFKIQFDLEYFNRITKGGLSRKTLNIILAGCVHPDTKVRIRIRIKKKE